MPAQAKRSYFTFLACFGAALGLLALITACRLRLQQQSDAVFVSDGFGYFMYLPSVVIDGDLDLSNQIARQPRQDEHTFYQIVPQTGLPGNPFQVGCAVLWAPLFLLAHGAVLGLRSCGLDLSANGFGYAYELPVLFGTLVLHAIGVYYIYRLVSELWIDCMPGVVVASIVLGTPLAAYIWFEPGMAHGTSMCLISVLFYYLYKAWRDRDLKWTSWAGLGALCGLIAAVRATDVFVGLAVACVGFWLAWNAEPGRSASSRKIVAGAVVAFLVAGFLGFLPQMIAWKAIYGRFLVIPSGTNYERYNWLAPDLLGFLFSSWRGMFSWSPIWLVAVIGLVLGACRRNLLVTSALAGLAAAAYFTSCTPSWWVGCAFGTRRMVDYSVVFALGLAYVFHRWPSGASRTGLRHFLVVPIAFNWLLMVRYFTHHLPEYGHVSWYDLYVGTLLFPLRMLSG